MSMNGMYSRFNGTLQEGEFEKLKITDLEKFNEFKDEYNLRPKHFVTETGKEGEYPKTQYKYLTNLKDGQKGLMSGLALEQDKEGFKDFFLDLAHCVETPFKFFHSSLSGTWPLFEPSASEVINGDIDIGEIHEVVVDGKGRMNIETHKVKVHESETVSVLERGKDEE